jgi:hypothetical protein
MDTARRWLVRPGFRIMCRNAHQCAARHTFKAKSPGEADPESMPAHACPPDSLPTRIELRSAPALALAVVTVGLLLVSSIPALFGSSFTAPHARGAEGASPGAPPFVASAGDSGAQTHIGPTYGGDQPTWHVTHRLATPFGPQLGNITCSSEPGVPSSLVFANASCKGHDQPGISFYSDVPGSGGNLTWNVTLPTDGGPNRTQSDLYGAVWFGLPMSAPSAWMGICYFELQLFPDASWTAARGVDPGNWVGLAVGWQLSSTTGTETPCFIAPLRPDSGGAQSFFNMTQGDRLSVSMTGWANSPTGEVVRVSDLTSGVTSSVTLYNSTGQYPLDPAYSTSGWPDAWPWSPAGYYPASMAFEVGTPDAIGAVTNSSFSGCTPGTPPAGPSDPFIPCPSYDPASWVNDTGSPWIIGVPTFSAGGTAQLPAQVAFDQGFGGVAAISILSNGSCTPRIGSTDCSYPWFSFACAVEGFEFGATDYAGVTDDFGQYLEYPSSNTTSRLGLAYFAPAPYAIPSCSGRNYGVNVTAATGGSVSFLGTGVNGTEHSFAIAAGNYSLAAAGTGSDGFGGWLVGGLVSVANPSAPITNLQVSGAGWVTAVFFASPPEVETWFNATAGNGTTLIYSGVTYTKGPPWAVVPNGSSIQLPWGVYTVQAAPAAGQVFSSFSPRGVLMSSTRSPVSTVVVGGGTTASITTVSTSSSSMIALRLAAFGDGSLFVQSNGISSNGSSQGANGTVSLDPGTYSAVASPALGWAFLGWRSSGSLIQTEFAANTNITVGPGPARLVARFGARVGVVVNPVGGGGVSFNGSPPATNGSSEILEPGEYSLDAIPASNSTFSHWSVANRSALWVTKPGFPLVHLRVNATSTVTAVFTPSPGGPLSFSSSPSVAGAVLFNGFQHYASNVTNGSVANGTYLVSPVVSPGYRFAGWSVSGPVTMNPGSVSVHGSGGHITATFAPKDYLVTFVAPPGSGSGRLNGTWLTSGASISLPLGSYSLQFRANPNETFAGWSSSFEIGARGENQTTVIVNSAGTIAALSVGFALGPVTVSSTEVDVGTVVTYHAELLGSSEASFLWQALPPGCGSPRSPVVSCAPTSPGTYASVVVTVTGASGFQLMAPAPSLLVSARPLLTAFSVSPASVDAGIPFYANATVSGGTFPPTFGFHGLPPGCTSQNTSRLRCVPDGAGSFTIEVEISDPTGAVAFGNASIQVMARPAVVSFTSTAAVVDLGTPLTLSASVRGGTGPWTYTYFGLPAGCTSASGLTLFCLPSATGTYTVGFVARDNFQAASFANITVQIDPAPAIDSFVATPGQITLGSAAQFVVDASGGTSWLSYSYAGLPVGCSSENLSTLSCAPASAGNFTVRVVATDALGVSVSASVALDVLAPVVPAHPSGTHGTDYLPWIALVAGLAIVGVAGFYVLLRRRRSPQTPAGSLVGVPRRP